MSAAQYRRDLERKRQAIVDTQKKAADERAKESKKRLEMTKARESASRSSSMSHVRSKLNEAERREKEANDAMKRAVGHETKIAALSKEANQIQTRLFTAEQNEAATAERVRKREEDRQRQATDRAHAALAQRVTTAEYQVAEVLRFMPDPEPERLRVLMLGASAAGDIRVAREQTRIRRAVQAALLRDSLEIDAHPAATIDELLEGISRFRPHVIHFSGHAADDELVFERDEDGHHEGHTVSASAFAKAVMSTDDPPLLIVLNGCSTAGQLAGLIAGGVPFAIGMTDEIDDSDAIVYAARFYGAIANGQSVQSAHELGRVNLELNGLAGADLPELCHAVDVDPLTVLVLPPAS